MSWCRPAAESIEGVEDQRTSAPGAAELVMVVVAAAAAAALSDFG
jgi:hypothetical protein